MIPSANGQAQQPQAIDMRRLAFVFMAMPIYFAFFMFLPAGSWTWAKDWLFIGVFLGLILAVTVYLWRVNPEVVVARSGYHDGTKAWDKILLRFFFTAVYAIIPVAALDGGRFHWFPVAPWVCGVGYAVFFAGMWIVAWAEAENKFFEVTVRIQTERGHRVIDSGPYALVRHPGYVGGILLSVGIALCLGSVWALLPAGVSSALLLVRTKWEDETLQAELSGYKEYTQRVRYRMIPGVW